MRRTGTRKFNFKGRDFWSTVLGLTSYWVGLLSGEQHTVV